jgi:hypothetical protein
VPAWLARHHRSTSTTLPSRRGAVPVRIGGAGASLDANFEHAIRIIDGNPVNLPVVSQAPAEADTEFVYECLR